LEDEVHKKKQHTECTVADQLQHLRSQQEHYFSLSFDTISACGASGAVIHYHPTVDKCSPITEDMFLLDSGGQYFDGTTDITRTMFLGQKPTDYHRECFTRVLQGHIAIDQCIFPKGTSGSRLDALARTALWKVGKDFRHGVGHGVGHFLNVHEGPQNIGSRLTGVALQPGMTVTDEPGYYEAGKFGIRIENVLIVREAKEVGEDFMKFEHITCVPLQTKLIAKHLMTQDEIQWVNDYNQFCLNSLLPLLKDDPATTQWLKNNTQAL
jgi:Xaa-Pro aminopeptidase